MNHPIKDKIPGKSYLSGRQARILVAPLDWGLGHATRCIPIIRELLLQGCDVWLAAENAQEILLKEEFPDLPFLQLAGYRIKYARTKRGLIWKMIQQGPKMKRAIRHEKKWLKKMVDEYKIDAVISDNRYGLSHSTIPCIFITHQLKIKSPVGKWTEKILQKRNYQYINQFAACWVPDLELEYNLAGELSHPEIQPAVYIHYIGLLSRFEKKEITEKKNHLLVILSGPEPQRTILEEKIINEISHFNGTAIILRGLPDASSVIPSTNMIKFYNHLNATALNVAMQEAEYVICRSGYSSVMDIAKLEKKSILIPTPGQTEQEYLGKYLMSKGLAISVNQDEFSLSSVLDSAASYNYKLYSITLTGLLKERIQQFVKQVLKK